MKSYLENACVKREFVDDVQKCEKVIKNAPLNIQIAS